MKFLSLVILLISLNSFSQDEIVIDSLKRVIDSDAHDTTKIKALYAWDDLIYYFDTELDFELNEQVISIADKNLISGNNSSELLEFYARCKAKSLNILGTICIEAGKNEDGQSYLYQCLAIAEQMNDSLMMYNALSNLGSCYNTLKFYRKAIDHYNRGIDCNRTPVTESYYHLNLGIIYYSLGDYDSSQYHNYKSIALADELEIPLNLANTKTTMAEVYYSQEKYDSSILYFSDALWIYEELNVLNRKANVQSRIGDVYYTIGDHKKSLEYCLKAKEVLKEVNSYSFNYDCYYCLYNNYKYLGQTQKALESHELLKAYGDSLELERNIDAMLDAQYQYDFEKKRIEDSLNVTNKEQIKQAKLEANIEQKETQQLYLYAGLILLSAIGILIFRGYRRKQKDNQIIAEQKKEVENQRDIIEEKQEEIIDSINYAKRIQDAILPPDLNIQKHLPNSFIIYQPKDVVSGDFYWFEEKNGAIYIAAADCTGHGVPGAMVSVVCSNSLNRAVNEFDLQDPGKILDKTRELVIDTFSKNDSNVRDGMDIALCKIEKNELSYAGAHNPLWIIRKGNSTIEETKATKQPVGLIENPVEFETHKFRIESGDTFYIFSDGFADQFGGPKGKKFKSSQFKTLISSIAGKNMEEQKSTLISEFEIWKGDFEQLDDVCVIGVRI